MQTIGERDRVESLRLAFGYRLAHYPRLETSYDEESDTIADVRGDPLLSSCGTAIAVFSLFEPLLAGVVVLCCPAV